MTLPQPNVTPVSEPYWSGLRQGELRYQHCDACGHNWLPARPACPSCLGRKISWCVSAGKGAVVSWVVYHQAYADHLAARVPYDVTLVELDEGPRLLTNIIDSDAGRHLAHGRRVVLAIEHEGDVPLARFKLDAQADAT